VTGRNALGRSRGDFSTKINARTNADGLPIGIEITPGQIHDVTAYSALMNDIDCDPEQMLGDKGYDSQAVRRDTKRPNGLPADFLEQLLVGCGRPVLIAGPAPTPAFAGTIMVCWKESPEAARAVNAAMSFLRHARRVVVISIAENDDNPAESLAEVASLDFHGTELA
jgi:Transposase DDE domain